MSSRAKRTLILIIAVLIALFVYVKVQKWLDGHYAEQFKELSEEKRISAAAKLVNREKFAEALAAKPYARQENGLLACAKLAETKPEAFEAMIRLFGFVELDSPVVETSRELLVQKGNAATQAVIEGLNQPRNDNDPADELKIRLNCASILGDLGDEAAIQPLIDTLNKKDMREAVGTRKRYDYTLYEDWPVKYAASGALLKLGGDKAIAAVSNISRELVATLVNTEADETERVTAATALKDIADPTSVATLTRVATTDSNWIIRKLTVQALAAVGDTASEQALVKVATLGETSELAQPATYEAALALADSAVPEAKAALLFLLENPDWTIRQAASEGLLAKNAPEMVAKLIDQLASFQPERRQSAARMLGRARATSAVPKLIPLIKDQNAEVRAASAQALGLIGAPEALPALVGALDDEFYPTRTEASAAITKLGVDKALDLLLPKLKSNNPDVREITARSLARSESAKAIPALKAVLTDEDPFVGAAAAAALAELKATDAAPQIARLLEDDHADVRLTALVALRDLADPSVAPQVRKLIELDPEEKGGEKDGRVRYWCAEVLGKLQDAESKKELTNLLKDKDHGVRIVAAGALAQLGEKRGMKYLHKVMKDKQEWIDIRRMAAVRLARLGEEKPVTFLLEQVAINGYPDVATTANFLNDIDEEVTAKVQAYLTDPMGILRAAALKSLAMLEEDKAIPDLTKALETDGLERVRIFAAESLGDLASPESRVALNAALTKQLPESVAASVRLQLARF